MSSTDQSEQGQLPAFDGTPIQAALFLRDIGEYAARHGYLTLLLKGFFVSRGTIFCASADALLDVKNFYLDPIGHPLPSNIMEPPNPPIAATRNCTYVPTADDRRLYAASPEIFLATSAIVAERMIAAVTSPDVARRIRTAANGDARMALVEIATIRDEVTPAQIAFHMQKISNHVKAGVVTADPAAWSRWKHQYSDYLWCLPATHALPDTYVAQDYRRAIQPLGPEVCLLVSTEVKIRNAESNPVATAAAIHRVVEDMSVRTETASAGSAFAASGDSHPQHGNKARTREQRSARQQIKQHRFQPQKKAVDE